MSDQPKIYVAGHRGMVGSALIRELLTQGVGSENLITHNRQDLDLTNQRAVQEFFAQERSILLGALAMPIIPNPPSERLALSALQ